MKLINAIIGIRSRFAFVIVVLLTSGIASAQKRPIAHFKFDEIRVKREVVEMVRGETYVPKEVFAYVKESVSGLEYDLEGKYYKEVGGVVGKAALLDGYSAYIRAEEVYDEENEDVTIKPIPEIDDKFTVEAWVALGAYPKNFCPVFSHRRPVEEGGTEGYSLEIDAWGRPILMVATLDGKMETLIVDKTINLNEWTHIAGSYSAETGMSVYLNGELAGNRKFKGDYSPIVFYEGVSILIGKSRIPYRPTGTIRPYGTEESFTYLDGIIDELKLFDQVVDARDIKSSYNKNKPSAKPELPERKLPSGPQSPGIFRAVNTTLEYYPGWDAPWAVKDNADIVVQFDQSDCKFVFWRGTSYIPSWVSENGIHYNNGFNEGWNDHGSCEPMSDKKTKYSSVKIVESNEARIVVQWRYALVDVTGVFAFEDPETGWGDWTNETYYIYPDMTAVREDVLLSNAPHAAHEWQESMMVLGPGQRPEDVLEYDALILANIQGETKTYSWEFETPPGDPELPANKNAQIVNTKSEYKPFSAIRPQDIEGMDIYAGEIRRQVSVFPWWNHWPVAPRPTDGRYANFADRAAHASLSHWFWKEYKSDDRSMTKIMLCGMTKGDINGIVRLNKSWSYPAEIVVNEAGIDAEYRPEQKAYNIKINDDDKVSFTLEGSNQSPVINPAFVIENWGANDVEISLNDKVLTKGKDVRYDHRHTLNSIDLIVWLKFEDEKKVSFSFTRK